MSNYQVDLTAPIGHTVPKLLEEFGRWLAQQSYGALGWFSVEMTSVPTAWAPDKAERLRREDLFSIYGVRKGPSGHDEPTLDNDEWDVVDKAIPALDQRFAEWVRIPG